MLLQTSSAQRAADREFAENGGNMDALIRSAALGLSSRIEERYRLVAASGTVSGDMYALFLCGKGNNGRDGIEAADILASRGIASKTVNVFENTPGKPELGGLIKNSFCVADCIFGCGFSPEREIPANVAEIIDMINDLSPWTVSADIPSGVSADTGEISLHSVRANETVTFGALKPGLMIMPGKRLAGKVTVARILIPSDKLIGEGAGECFLEESLEDVRKLLPRRDPCGNKYSNGRCLVVAGSEKYAGAAVLAVSAALRGGAGLVTAAVPGSIADVITAACPEAVRLPLGGKSAGYLTRNSFSGLIEASEKADAAVIGPGIGREPETVSCVLDFMAACRCSKLIVDADALFALASAEKPGPAALFEGKDVIITPHSGEAAKLLETTAEIIDGRRLFAADSLAKKLNDNVLLKGNDTLTVSKDGNFTVNAAGNSALSKGGSGDVLAGLIGSLAAQGLSTYDAGRAGAFIHGLAAQRLSEKMTEFCVLPSDLAVAFSEIMW